MDAGSVVVVGGTSGTGREIARLFAERGREVVLSGRDAQRARAVAAEIGGRTLGVGFDLAEPEEIATGLRGVGPVDHLVLAALERDENTARDYDVKRAIRLATLKLVGYTEVVHALVPRMGSESSVVMFGGLAKDRPYPGSTTVATVNGGIATLVHALAVELAPIRVNAVHPAIVGDSPYWAHKPAAVLEGFRSRTPTGRLLPLACQPGGAGVPRQRRGGGRRRPPLGGHDALRRDPRGWTAVPGGARGRGGDGARRRDGEQRHRLEPGRAADVLRGHPDPAGRRARRGPRDRPGGPPPAVRRPRRRGGLPRRSHGRRRRLRLGGVVGRRRGPPLDALGQARPHRRGPGGPHHRLRLWRARPRRPVHHHRDRRPRRRPGCRAAAGRVGLRAPRRGPRPGGPPLRRLSPGLPLRSGA